MWTWEIESIGQFVEYLLPVYSGQPSIAEIIITNVGLFRLFSECGNEEMSETVKIELRDQAQVCRRNLDVTLNRLPFNLPSTFDYVLALYQAVSTPRHASSWL